MINECGAFGGMRIIRTDRGTRRKPAPVPLCPSQIPHDMSWGRLLVWYPRSEDACHATYPVTAYLVVEIYVAAPLQFV
jgi:hypothetical protein